MTLKRVLCLGVLGVTMSTRLALSQGTLDTPTPELDVHVWEGKPPAIEEGFVQVRNLGSLHWRIEVTRTFTIPPKPVAPELDPYPCHGCDAGCGGTGPGGVCALTKTDTLQVKPSQQAGACRRTSVDCFPNGSTDPQDCCDNTDSLHTEHCNFDRNGDGVHTKADEFCGYYSFVNVRAIAFRSNEDELWTTTDVPLCGLSQSATGIPPVLDVPACPKSRECAGASKPAPCL